MTVAASGAIAATAGNSGAKAPGGTTTPNGWTTPANASANDGTYATARPTSGNSLSQGYDTFALGVPLGSIVDGIEVVIKAKSTDSAGCTLDVRLSGNGGTTLRTKSINLTDSDASPFTLGSPTDTWGQVWDPTQTTNGNFQVQLRANDGGTACNDAVAAPNDEATTSVDYFTVTVYYRTINQHTNNPALSGTVCHAGDFNFIIDMSGSIGQQGNIPSNLQQMKDGINGFVNAFQGAGGDGRYAGTKFNGSSAANITSGYTTFGTFQTAVNNLTSPSGLTPTATGITTGAANSSGDRAGIPNVMFVLTDGSPNKPNTHSDDLSIPETWLQGADGAVNAANSARSGGYVVEAVYLSTDNDPGDTGLPFSVLGDRSWATQVMDEIGGGNHFPADFKSFVDDLFKAIDCPPPPPADIHITKTANPTGPVLVGGTIGFDISISNSGQGAATGVTIHDVLPNGPGLNWSLVPPFTGCAIAPLSGPNQVLDCSFPSLAAVNGSKGPIHVQSGTTKGDCGTITNTATVDATNDDPVSNPASVVVQCPDVSVVKTPDSGTVNAGQNAVFTIVVTNGGPGPATGVTLSDTLPTGYTWTKAGANAGDCTIATGVLTCNFGTVAANDTRTVTLTAPTTGQNCAVIPNTATVVASNEKAAGNNNSDDASIDVLCGNVGIVKTANPAGPVSAGGEIGFDITVNNTGDGAANAVHVVDNLPQGISWTADATTGTASATCAIDTTLPLPDVLTCDAAAMAAGANFKVHIHGITDAQDCGVIGNSATVSSGNDGGGTTPVASVTVQCPDIEVTKTPDNGIVNAGDPIVWTIVVKNVGLGTAKGVILTDTLPGSIAWSTSDAGCSITTNILTCNVGDLATGASKTYTVSGPTTKANCGPAINNTGSATATNEPQTQNVLANNSNQGSVTVQCPNIHVTKTASPAGPVSAGTDIGFNIGVSNSGPGIASNVTIHDDLPGGGLNWSLAPAFGGCAITGAVGSQDLDCTFATMGVTSVGPIHVVSHTTGENCGTVSNTASAFSGNDGGAEATASVTVECPDVHVVKTADSGTISAGDLAKFTIVASNSGPGVAKAVTLTDTLPTGVTWAEDSTSCSIAAGVLTCNFGDLASGASATVHVTGTTDAADCGTLTNTATVGAANESQAAAADNSSTATIAVQCPQISVAKTAVVGTISAGELASFKIVVSNAGPGTAKGVVITDTLPAGIAWIVNDTTDCNIATGVLTCTFATIASGADVTVIITGETSADDCGTLTNTATVSAANEGPLLQDAIALAVGSHSSTATIEVDCAQVVITKTAEHITAVAGETIAFTIEIKNNGAGTAFGVTASDTLPTGQSWVISPASAGWTIDAGVLKFGPANLASGASTSVRIQAVTDATDCGVVQNTASFQFTGNQGDSDRSDIKVRCPEVDLQKSTTDADGKVEPNQTVTYGIDVSVTDGPVTNAVVTDTLPVGQTYVVASQSSTPAATSFAVSPDGRTLTWVFASLDGADAASIGYNATIDAGASSGDQTNEAGVCVDEPLVDCASDTVVVLVQKPSITIVKTAGDAANGAVFETEPGSVTYTYVITNSGPLALTGVGVTDDNGTPGTPGDDFAATCPKTALAPAESMTCSATVLVTAGKTNVATVHGVTAGGNTATGSDDAVVEILVHGLVMAKSNNAPIEHLELPDKTFADLPTAKEGSTVTFTLHYTFSGTAVTNGVVTDVLPLGLTYVTGSATNSGEFIFAGYNPTTRTLTWNAAKVTASGTVTYQAKVDKGAAALEQPLTNVATIDSAETEPSSDTSDVFVPVPPEAETHVPTAPPTDTLEPTGGPSGTSLPLILAILGVILLAVAFVTPAPATVRRRNRR